MTHFVYSKVGSFLPKHCQQLFACTNLHKYTRQDQVSCFCYWMLTKYALLSLLLKNSTVLLCILLTWNTSLLIAASTGSISEAMWNFLTKKSKLFVKIYCKWNDCVIYTGSALPSTQCTSWRCWLTWTCLMSTSCYRSTRSTSSSLSIDIGRCSSFNLPPYRWWSCCITYMELSSAGSRVVNNSTNISIQTEDLSVFSFFYWGLAFFVQWLQCFALYNSNFWLWL